MKKIFLISDTHFGHKNILSFAERPFVDLKEMEEKLISNWNSAVGKNDTIYHLGDFSFEKFDETKRIFDQLNGIKHLILGNHDRRSSRTYWRRVGFDIVSGNPILIRKKYLLSHEPIVYNIGDFINIHGHTHAGNHRPFDSANVHINVSVEAINYKPIEIGELNNAIH
jgi:calcineurin-like phosphoesterase family protein